MNVDPISVRRAIPDGAQIARVPARDGWPLRAFNWPVEGENRRGAILFQAGRGDMFEKHLEAMARWHNAGWDVTSFDWRGQGGSGRMASNPHVGHIDDFKIWIDDLSYFWANWSATIAGPHVVMGHSMGGHLILRALVEKAISPDGAVLIAPMLGIESPPMSPAMAARFASLMAKMMPRRLPAWPSNEKPSLPYTSRQRFLTHDHGRYADEIWWRETCPELVLGPPSWQWLDAAYQSIAAIDESEALERLNLPVLVLATEGDRLVSPAATKRIVARVPRASLKLFGKTVAHEILREVDAPREQALMAIDGFLDGVAAR